MNVQFWQLFFCVCGGIGFLWFLWWFLNRPQQLTVEEAKAQAEVAQFTTIREWEEDRRVNIPWRTVVERQSLITLADHEITEQKILASDRVEAETAMREGKSLLTHRAQLLSQMNDLSYVIRSITDGTLKIQDTMAQTNGQLLASAQAQMQKLEDERRAVENQIKLQEGLDVTKINAGEYNERRKVEFQEEVRLREKFRREDEAKAAPTPKKEAPRATKN